jgi:hypothetical protein
MAIASSSLPRRLSLPSFAWKTLALFAKRKLIATHAEMSVKVTPM